MAPTQVMVGAKRKKRTRLDISKLSKADLRKIEDDRRNYLLAKFGTEEQKKHFAHLTSGEPPYDIFLDMAESAARAAADAAAAAAAAAPPPPAQQDPVEGPAPKPAPDPAFENRLANEIPLNGPPLNQPPPNQEIPMKKSKSEGLFGEEGPRMLGSELSDDLLDDEDYADDQDDSIDDAEPTTASLLTTTIVVQPTAQPVGLTFGQATYIQSSPLDRSIIEPKIANQNELILWWAVLASLVVFALYRIANSRCWRRIQSGRRRSI